MTAVAPAIFIGWPRDTLAITSATWTNDSTTVDLILPASMTWETVCGRWITGPDGFDYLITLVTDTNTFTIDRPYTGTTVTLTDGAASIKADELPQGVSEPTDTAIGSADSDGLALIDFNDGNFKLALSGDDYNQFWNLEIKDSTNSSGLINVYGSVSPFFNGLLLQQSTQSDPIFYLMFGDGAEINRFIIKGSGAGGTQRGIAFAGYGAGAKIHNGAIYNLGDSGFFLDRTSYIEMNNINIGVEVANGNDDIYMNNSGYHIISGRDVKMGGTNGDVSGGLFWYSVKIVNPQKVFGSYKQFDRGVTLEKVAVTDTNANKKLSDNVIEIILNTGNTYQFKEIGQKIKVFESRKTYDAGTYNIKVWIYNDTGNTLNDTTYADDILLRCRSEAAGYGDATTEYVSKWYYSDEIDILDAADADDWDYLQADSVVVDVNDAKIYCEVLVSTYDASG